MQYLITFMEGILSFISPCMLPLLPVYISFFMGQEAEKKSAKSLVNAIAFVVGFSSVFSMLGLFAGTLSSMLKEHQIIVNIVSGAIIVVFGLSYLGVLRLAFPGITKKQIEINGVITAFLFGMVYSVSLTPCVGAFLGAALAMASASGSSLKGLLLLVSYSVGMGLPFVLSAILINQLKGTFNWIKQHYSIIEKFSGAFLIFIGLLMASGYLTKFTSSLFF